MRVPHLSEMGGLDTRQYELSGIQKRRRKEHDPIVILIDCLARASLSLSDASESNYLSEFRGASAHREVFLILNWNFQLQLDVNPVIFELDVLSAWR